MAFVYNTQPRLHPLFNLTLLMVLLTTSVGLGITAQEVRERSRTDPEAAWDLYLFLLQRSPEPEELESLGRFVFAKRKLKEFKFVLEEDIPQLVSHLASHDTDVRTRSYLMEVFDVDRLNQYIASNLKRDRNVLYLLTLMPTVEETTLGLVVEKLIEDQSARRMVFGKLRKSILPITKIKDRFIGRLTDLVAASTGQSDRKRYLSIYVDVRQLVGPEFSHPELDKMAGLGGRHQRGTGLLTRFLSAVTGFVKKGGSWFFPLVATVSLTATSLTLFAFPNLRYHVYKTLGLKRRAAIVYRRIVERDPLNEEKRLKLAQLYEEAGMVEEAMNEYSFLQRIRLE